MLIFTPMQYLETDYDGMKWAIHKLSPKISCLDEYPELKLIFTESCAVCDNDTWKSFIKPNQLMRYIVYCYHYQSPIARKNADVIERKKIALKEAGVDLIKLEKNTEAKSLLSKIILGRYDFTSHLALHFLKFEDNLSWMQVCRLNELIYDTYAMLQTTDDKTSEAKTAKDRADAYAKSKVYEQDMSRLSKQLFVDDLTLQNFIASHILREKRKALITPERVAKLIEENGGVITEDAFEINPNK